MSYEWNGSGGGEEAPKGKGPAFVGKPRIVPKAGLVVMEVRVKSTSKVTATWFHNTTLVSKSSTYNILYTEEGDNTYLLELEIIVITLRSQFN